MRTIRQATGHAQSGSDQPGPAAPAATGASPGACYRIDWDALRTAERSCCCTARPAVIAMMPPVPDRMHRTDLLLCMHHFRGARDALVRAGARAFNLNRRLVDQRAPAYLPVA